MRVPVVLLAVLLAACTAGVGTTTRPTSAGEPPSSVPTTTLPPVVSCPGPGDFDEGSGLGDFAGSGSDSSTLGLISWESGECDSFVFGFETSEGAPATTVPDIRIDHLTSFQVVRIKMDIASTVVTDQLVESGLVDRLYVVRALDGGMFVDLHLNAPVAVRARVESSPARLTVDLRPGFVDFEGEAAIGDRVVVTSPANGATTGSPVAIEGYARTSESQVMVIVTQGDQAISTTTTDAVSTSETWGEFATEVPLPLGSSSVFVGDSDPGDGGLEGITIDLTVN